MFFVKSCNKIIMNNHLKPPGVVVVVFPPPPSNEFLHDKAIEKPPVSFHYSARLI